MWSAVALLLAEQDRPVSDSAMGASRLRSGVARAATGAVGGVALLVIALAVLWSLPATGPEGTNQSPSPAPTSPAGISESQAITLAQAYAPLGGVQASVQSGSFAELNPNPSDLSDLTTPQHPVWAIVFKATFNICPPTFAPDGSSCERRPGTTTVILDFATGDFIESYGISPPL